MIKFEQIIAKIEKEDGLYIKYNIKDGEREAQATLYFENSDDFYENPLTVNLLDMEVTGIGLFVGKLIIYLHKDY